MCLAGVGNVMVWALLTLSGLLDFSTTLCLCVIVTGFSYACRCVLAEADNLSALFN